MLTVGFVRGGAMGAIKWDVKGNSIVSTDDTAAYPSPHLVILCHYYGCTVVNGRRADFAGQNCVKRILSGIC